MRCTYNLHDFFHIQDVQCDKNRIYLVSEKREDETYFCLTVDLRKRKTRKRVALGYPYFGQELFGAAKEEYFASQLYDFRAGKYGYNMRPLEEGYMHLEKSEDKRLCPVYPSGNRPNFFLVAGQWSYHSAEGIVIDVMTGEKKQYLPPAEFYYSHHDYVCYLIMERGEQKLVVHEFSPVAPY